MCPGCVIDARYAKPAAGQPEPHPLAALVAEATRTHGRQPSRDA